MRGHRRSPTHPRRQPVQTVSDLTSKWVTTTTETDRGETVVRFTGWRAVLDPTFARRHPHCGEMDLAIVADDAHHGPGVCDCHDGGSAVNMLGMSVPDGSERELTTAAVTEVEREGFRVAGPWVAGPGGMLVVPLVPADVVVSA